MSTLDRDCRLVRAPGVMVDEPSRVTGSRTIGGAPRPSSVDRSLEREGRDPTAGFCTTLKTRSFASGWVAWRYPRAAKGLFVSFTGWRPRRAYPGASTDRHDTTDTERAHHTAGKTRRTGVQHRPHHPPRTHSSGVDPALLFAVNQSHLGFTVLRPHLWPASGQLTLFPPPRTCPQFTCSIVVVLTPTAAHRREP